MPCFPRGHVYAGSREVSIPTNLHALSIKDLKEILESLDVDFSDCREKSKLVNRINIIRHVQ